VSTCRGRSTGLEGGGTPGPSWVSARGSSASHSGPAPLMRRPRRRTAPRTPPRASRPPSALDVETLGPCSPWPARPSSAHSRAVAASASGSLCDVGPRFFAASPASAPLARCFRQLTLDGNCYRVGCLKHVGTEGSASQPNGSPDLELLCCKGRGADSSSTRNVHPDER